MKNSDCTYSPENLTHERLYLNEFARNLRHIADDDYIDARTLYRNKRYRGFIYHASQAVEKYLKCILLFIEIKIPTTHDLDKLLGKVTEYSNLELKNESLEFIKELNGLGEAVRYDHTPYYFRYELLHYLDFFVRDIRPYCKNRCVPAEFLQTETQDAYLMLKSGHEYKSPRIFLDGKLEKLIKSKAKKDRAVRGNLIWNNPYFYKIKRNKFSVIRGTQSRNLSPLIPEGKNSKGYFEYLKRFYPFHKTVIDYYKSR